MFYLMGERQFRDIWQLNMVGLWRIATVDGWGQRWGCVWRVGVRVEVVRAVARVKLDLLSCFWATVRRDATTRCTIAHHTSASSSYLHDIPPKNYWLFCEILHKFSIILWRYARFVVGESCVFGNWGWRIRINCVSCKFLSRLRSCWIADEAELVTSSKWKETRATFVVWARDRTYDLKTTTTFRRLLAVVVSLEYT